MAKNRAAATTPAIAGVTAPAGPSSLLTPTPPQKVTKPKPFMSEGMRGDLENVGYTVDPVSGARFELGDDGKTVTMKERKTNPETGIAGWGDPVEVDVVLTSTPADTDQDDDAVTDEGAADTAAPQS